MRSAYRAMPAVLCLLAAVGFAAGAGASDEEREKPAAGAGAERSAQSEGSAQAVAEPAAGWVERAALTTAVIEREPQDSVESLTSDHVEIYFFTELRGLEGQTVTHRWEHEGSVVAEVPMAVGGSRWRTYSRKQLTPGGLGSWTVSVVDGDGQVLERRSFIYSDAGPSGVAERRGSASAPEAPPAAPQP